MCEAGGAKDESKIQENGRGLYLYITKINEQDRFLLIPQWVGSQVGCWDRQQLQNLWVRVLRTEPA